MKPNRYNPNHPDWRHVHSPNWAGGINPACRYRKQLFESPDRPRAALKHDESKCQEWDVGKPGVRKGKMTVIADVRVRARTKSEARARAKKALGISRKGRLPAGVMVSRIREAA